MKTEFDTKRLKKENIGSALSLSDYEKEISFLNNYIVLKKIRNVNAKNVFNIEVAKTDPDQLGDMQKSKETIRKIMAERVQKKVNRKFNKKFKLPDTGGEEDMSVSAV